MNNKQKYGMGVRPGPLAGAFLVSLIIWVILGLIISSLIGGCGIPVTKRSADLQNAEKAADKNDANNSAKTGKLNEQNGSKTFRINILTGAIGTRTSQIWVGDPNSRQENNHDVK